LGKETSRNGAVRARGGIFKKTSGKGSRKTSKTASQREGGARGDPRRKGREETPDEFFSTRPNRRMGGG